MSFFSSGMLLDNSVILSDEAKIFFTAHSDAVEGDLP